MTPSDHWWQVLPPEWLAGGTGLYTKDPEDPEWGVINLKEVYNSVPFASHSGIKVGQHTGVVMTVVLFPQKAWKHSAVQPCWPGRPPCCHQPAQWAAQHGTSKNLCE